MTTKTMLIVGFFVLAAAVVILGVVFQGENTTKTVAVVVAVAVAVAGFLISVVKPLYDVFDKERERKKRSQESQERVKVTAKYGHWDSTGTELGVVIYNEGSTTLHIQSVACHYIPSDGVKEELIFSNLNYACTELLEPKHTAKFHCDSFKEVVLKQISTLPKENVWITINSYQGEIYRVGGEEIIKVLNSPPTTQFG